MLFALLFALGLSAANACCLPPQWQALAYDLNNLDINPFYMTFGHDDHTKRVGIYLHQIGVDGVYRHYVKDYNTMTEYETGMGLTGCVKRKLKGELVTNAGCQRNQREGVQNLQHHGSDAVGLYPDTIQMDTVSYQKDGAKIVAGIGQNGCFPIYQKIQALPGSGALSKTLFYSNATATTPDADLMDIPASCQ